ncbi:UDP-3-O-(3-hydroxymyristoyl)glucosamine N-acyltransferase [Variovorax sp. PCZ-1]|uniref:UDP-3-O-(3-hydroxymyristoyl)glucosamine N-acyltransferase n=1 Tax=Variovorax sp. PCZ-1 TaxID=2835533 RepID=UPI001BCF9FBD|nr:UDP-3-O-(3-hydroxymyristoyl)glucosamine N-acyltransferase [Variovorax sp. PCZ-1]MBS7806489.1 UDP-3-O-(3-hydroxymyristoyl)glucosamine N-acyltransferase [Variovorax sp. PCZ-1]
MTCTLSEITRALGGTLHGDTTLAISRIAPLVDARAGEISFLSHPKYAPQLAQTQASCVILSVEAAAGIQDWVAQGRAWIETDSPYLYFARLTQWWKQQHTKALLAGVHPSAVIDATARIDPTASIGPLSFVGAGASVGAHTRLAARVTIEAGCQVGQRCILHSGVVIGADGFGFAPRPDKSWEKIEQLGAVRIGNDVEIGANTCIDRGALDDTIVEDGVKLDNLIQIGHNVKIGKHTAMAGNAGVAGSATIGAYCSVGGGAVILGHLTIADHVHISASTTVTRSISEPGLYTGMFPIDKNADWEKNAVTLRQLHKLRERIRELEKRLTD